jgi:hypothetical protein
VFVLPYTVKGDQDLLFYDQSRADRQTYSTMRLSVITGGKRKCKGVDATNIKRDHMDRIGKTKMGSGED